MSKGRVRLNVPQHLRRYERTRITPMGSAQLFERPIKPEQLERLLIGLRSEFDDLTDKHHDAIRRSIAHRYRVSRKVAAEPELLEVLSMLVGKPVTSKNAIRFVFKLSVRCSKKASKYYRRIKPIWDSNGTHEEVYEFLRREGLESNRKRKRAVATESHDDSPPRQHALWQITDKHGRNFRVEVAAEDRTLLKFWVESLK